MSNPKNSENNKANLNSKEVPFFARYLEGQTIEDLSEEEMKTIGGSFKVVTEKYPSDQEDGGGLTRKYPSDTDEMATTLKYPSDHEEGGSGTVTTLKYPSDHEDGGYLK